MVGKLIRRLLIPCESFCLASRVLLELTDDGVVEGLESLYTSMDDLDLWNGGLAEDPVAARSLVLYFQESMIHQFVALRDGDRFWFQNILTDDGS